MDSHGNLCLMTTAYLILSRIQQAMSSFVSSLKAPARLYVHHSAARQKSLPIGLTTSSKKATAFSAFPTIVQLHGQTVVCVANETDE